ncbi:mitochondrial coenzyme A diphosphatase NUDT8 [Drosophila biarmipes]|uniref:mitochondrial coenzyme A diphosphatase NUDT8 n=1 Tax=Drosophila biarmipes TaxID=125945 RepID=UPI0007E7099A|nr:mitochondrial coenzyme A diphosphatase NUDT8 [Drosophila biarmipes]
MSMLTQATRTAPQLLLHLNRHLSSSSATATSSEPPDGHVHPLMTPAELLGPESQRRCMEKMRSLPSFPRPKALTPSRREKQTSAVLIALCQERGTNEVSLLYTRRSRHLRSHSFQISFPGGRRDDQDTSYVDCALRETEEEIGLPRHRVQVWGEANQLLLPRTSSIVPVVGVVPDFSISELRLNWAEVEEAFSVPLKALMVPQATRHTQFRSGYSGPVFVVDHHRIWGITGYLTHLFLHSLLPPSQLPDCLRTNIKFIRPFKLPPKLPHHREHAATDPSMRT